MLRRVYEETDGNERSMVNFFTLAEKEGFDESYAIEIYDYLRSEGLFGHEQVDGSLSLSHRGVLEVEQSIIYPQKPTDHFPATVIQNFSGPIYGGVQTGGQNNTQHVSVNVNSSFGEAVKRLTELVNNSPASSLYKEESVQALERVQQLAQKEKSPDVVKLAKDKLDIVKTTLEVGKGLAEIAAPYLQIIAGYFS